MNLAALGLWLWGTVAGLDLVALGQFMVGRPLVAGTVAGFIAGDPAAGALLGMTLELFALDVLPVGAARYPDYGPAAVAGTAAAAGAPGLLGLGPGMAVALVVAYLGEWAIQVVRRRNSADVRRNRPALDAGDPACLRRLQLRGLLREAVRAALVTAAGLVMAAAVRRWLPLGVGASVLMGAVGLGVAAAVAAGGALRLSGQGQARAWFLAGLAAGVLWVAVR
jgi:PTS system mannose-specific IIC component